MEGHEYYTTDACAERLYDDSLEECLESWADGWLSREGDAEAELRRAGPVTVYGWRRRQLRAKDIDFEVDNAVERIDEGLGEEFGDAEDAFFSGKAMHILRMGIRAALNAALVETEVWTCEVVQERTYSPDEVIELMRAHRPDWFDAALAAEVSR